MSKIQTLHCQAGNHDWTRTVNGPGRPPIHCPEHKPVAAAPKASRPAAERNETETLHCAAGHDYERKVTRGRKPAYCDEHRPQPVIPTSSTPAVVKNGVKVRVLHCEAGDHDYECPSRRGRTPRNCPEHRSVAPVASESPSDPSETKVYTTPANVQAILDDPAPRDLEAQRALRYIEEQLHAGRDGVTSGLLYARTVWLRRFKVVATPVIDDLEDAA